MWIILDPIHLLIQSMIRAQLPAQAELVFFCACVLYVCVDCNVCHSVITVKHCLSLQTLESEELKGGLRGGVEGGSDTHTHTHAYKQCVCIHKQWTAWVHKHNKIFRCPKTPFPSSVLCIFLLYSVDISIPVCIGRHTRTHLLGRSFSFYSFYVLLHPLLVPSSEMCWQMSALLSTHNNQTLLSKKIKAERTK